MKIIVARPPNFLEILKVFPMATNKGTIFAYHDAIYSPSGRDISVSLLAHESVHLRRQGGTQAGAIAWWHQYMTDMDFRFYEELLAHRAEYQACLKLGQNRQQRRVQLKLIAKRLASPLYGRMVTQKQARDAITDVEKAMDLID